MSRFEVRTAALGGLGMLVCQLVAGVAGAAAPEPRNCDPWYYGSGS